jgi:hypothetical protein
MAISGELYYVCFHTERRNLLVLKRVDSGSACVFSDSDFTMKLACSSDVFEKLYTLIALQKGRDSGVLQLNNKLKFFKYKFEFWWR